MRRPTRRATALCAVCVLLISALVIWFLSRPDGVGSGGDDGGLSVADPESFAISGDAGDAVMPGVMQRLDLSLENLRAVDLSIDRITVSVEGVDAPHADATHPCGAADFHVRPSGSAVVVLEGGRTDSLSGMGMAREHWPAVGMLDRAVNQDGCKGALLTLGYEAHGVEVPR